MPRCLFTHNGKPTTLPDTEADAKRIALSQWITAMLVFNGDEQPGAYQTPGENGYTPTELADAVSRFAPEPPRSPKARTRKPKPDSEPIPKPVVEPAPAPPKKKRRSLRGEMFVKNHLTKPD